MLPILACWAALTLTPVPSPHQQQPVPAWHSESTNSLTIRWQGEQPLGGIAREAWAEARRRYPPHSHIAAELMVTPDPMTFRELARQPGWMLASTQANRIITQPEAILQRHGGARSVFLHEMLHILVEADATNHTPLWLREGLVEVLAGEAATRRTRQPVAEIEHGLQHPVSWSESQAAHRAAAALVTVLTDRYGVGAVRGWLTTGVPAGVLTAAAY